MMLRLIPKRIDKYGEYQLMVYYNGKVIHKVKKQDYKIDKNGEEYIEMDNIMIYYSDAPIGREKLVLKAITKNEYENSN